MAAQPLWLYLQFPQLQLDMLEADGSKTVPLVIVSSQQLQVQQLNQAAKDVGIKPKMALALACALSKQLDVIAEQTELAGQLLAQQAQLLYQLCADMVLAPPDAIWLRLDPMLNLYGGLAKFCQKLRDLLTKIGCTFNFAVADTMAAARLLCFHQPMFISAETKLIRQALHTCPLALLPLTPNTIRELQRLGLHSVGELFALPARSLNTRFPVELIDFLQELQGKPKANFCYYSPPEFFDQKLEPLYLIEQQQHLLPLCKVLLQQLDMYLQLRDQYCHQITLALSYRDQPTQLLVVSSAQGERQATIWLQLLQLRLEQTQLQAPVCALTLSVRHFVAKQAETKDLFQGVQGKLNRQQLLSILQARLGESRIFQPALAASHLPESANQLVACEAADSALPNLDDVASPTLPNHAQQNSEKQNTVKQNSEKQSAVKKSYADQGARKSKSNPSKLLPQSLSSDLARPLLLCSPPKPCPPPLDISAGVERILSPWWQPNFEQRDYVIARNAQGQWCWCYRDQQRQWFIHGYFS